MFTGIILAVGKIIAVQPQGGGDCRLKIGTGKLPLDDVMLGDSIAVSGVCLTAVELGDDYFIADVSNETLVRTKLGTAREGISVNLELAMTPNTRLGGHIVSGHVDGVGSVIEKSQDGRSYRYQFEAPNSLAKYIAEKGSICIDGVSLTVNQVDGALFTVNIVPHTLKETTFSELITGSQVNLEVDLLARYLERLIQAETTPSHSATITETFLQNTGFIT